MLRSALIAAALLAPPTLYAQSAGDPLPRGIFEATALRAGDSLRVTVWRKPELSGAFVIRNDGSIGSALYGDVLVAGLPIESVEQDVRARVEMYENAPRVFVEPLYRVSVGGEVHRPGLYAFGPSTTLTQAVMLAGGTGDRGRQDRLILVRDGVRQVVVLSDARGRGSMPVHSGDEITVPRRSSVFRDLIIPGATITGAVAAILSAVSR